MDLNSIIDQLESQTKTASVSPTSAPSVDNRLQGALASALEKTAAQAVADNQVSASDPVAGLMKMASELAGAERDTELALANMAGQAFADGAIAKFAAWDASVKTAAYEATQANDIQQLVKSASECGYNDVLALAAANQEKTAGVTEYELQKVAEQGYNTVMEKAAADYQQGYTQQLSEIHDLASREFLKGAAETEVLLQHVRQVAGR